jgi:hypothetical protein
MKQNNNHFLNQLLVNSHKQRFNRKLWPPAGMTPNQVKLKHHTVVGSICNNCSNNHRHNRGSISNSMRKKALLA